MIDVHLIDRRVASGSGKAFAILVNAYGALLFLFLLSILLNYPSMDVKIKLSILAALVAIGFCIFIKSYFFTCCGVCGSRDVRPLNASIDHETIRDIIRRKSDELNWFTRTSMKDALNSKSYKSKCEGYRCKSCGCISILGVRKPHGRHGQR